MAEVMEDAVSIIGNGIFERWRSCMDGISLFFIFVLRVERRHPQPRGYRLIQSPIATVKDAFADEEVMQGRSDERHRHMGREANFRSCGGWSEARGDSWAFL